MPASSGTRDEIFISPAEIKGQLARAIAASKRDPHGGKVLLPLEVAEALLRDLRR